MSISIRIAGNTTLPCLLAIKKKGYKINLLYIERNEDELQMRFKAQKEGCRFSANNAEELLGLIAMWEVRSNDWKYDPETEPNIYQELIDSAVIYDTDGNIIEE